MTTTVAMHEGSLEHIGERLAALSLDVNVLTFGSDGRFRVSGGSVHPSELDIEYFWLSSHASSDGGQQIAFETVLACRSVSVLQTYNAGLDHPFYRKAADRGIRICNSSAQGIAIAEYTIAQVMSVFHPIAEQRQMQAAREWRVTPFREISRTHWLIIGFGPIGRAIAARVKAFGAVTTVVRRSREASATADRVGTQSDLPSLLPDADVIVLACPLNEATRGMADEGFFAAVKPGAVLVNVARGGVIDDVALLAALDASRVDTAILDVFRTEPLPREDSYWSHPKVRLTPHTSFSGDGVQARWDQLFLDNIGRFVDGRPLIREVDPIEI
jgi:phosphoglycerate dehydrogenase-like enzyme